MFFAGGIIFGGMKDSLRAVWRWVRWPLYILAVGYVLLVLYDVQRLFDIDKTNEAVAALHAQKITLEDVQGTNLPPIPDQAENDATIEGIDKNNNGIRDDVELAIFKKYPSDKKARGAALQYASAEQMYLTKVFNTETWKAVAEETGRAVGCLINSELNFKELETIEGLVANTQKRKETRTKAFEFITSHGDAKGVSCDVSL